MTDFAALLQQGNAWLFVPSAIALGALHGLEPGHSKTLMAAFIVTVRGTLGQAVLLGLAATVSHTAVVWIVAMAGLYFGGDWANEATEARFQLASGLIIIGVAAWMIWRTRRDAQAAHDHAHHPAHPHSHDHDHDHGHGAALAHDHHAPHDPAPHAHGHPPAGQSGVTAFPADEPLDAHARAHAEEIARRFAGRQVSTGQILMFGLTGGLIPCPASITVLLLCLQLREFTLGAGLVLCFSIGLALTLVASGALASWGMNHVSKHWRGAEVIGALARRAPYVSGVLIGAVGLYVCGTAWRTLA